MAISSKPADIRLEVGVDVETSYEIFKKDIDELVRRVNAEPPKIKIALDEKALEKELAGVSSLINNIRKGIQGSNPSVSTVSINTDPVKKEATEVVSIFDKLESRINAIGGSQVELTRMRNALDLIKPILEEDGRLAEAFYTATNQVYSGHFFEQLAYSVKAYSDQIFDATQLTQQFDNIIMAQTSAAIPLPVSVDDTQIKQLRTLQAILKKASLEVEDFTKTKNNTSWGMSAARLLSVIEQNASAAQLKVLGLKRSLNSVDDVKGLLIGLATGTQGVSYNDGFGLDSFKTSTVQIREAFNSHKEFAQRIEQDNAGLIELRNSLINTFGNLPVDPESGALLVTLEQLRQVSSEAPAALQYIDEIEKRINMTLYENRGVTDTPISQIKVEAEEASNSEERLSNATKELVNTVNSGSGLGQLASALSQIQLLLDSINKSVGELAGNKAVREANPGITEMVDNLSVVKQLMTDINGENRKIQKAYSKVVGGLNASPESEANIQDLQTLQEEMGRYNSQLKELRANKATATEEDIRDMHRVQAGINEIISGIQARIDAEQAAAKATNGESLIKRMTDASTAAHRLLNSNVNSSSGSVAYEKLSTTLGELDKILIACERDAEKLPEQLGMSASEASAKVNTLLQTVSALQNELVYESKEGAFKTRGFDSTLRQMILLRDKNASSAGSEEYAKLTTQIDGFNRALRASEEETISLNEAFKKTFGMDVVSAIEAAKDTMESFKRKVAETAQSEASSSAEARANLNARWQSQGLTASNIKSLFGKASNNKELFGDFEAVRKQYEKVLRLHASLDKKNLDPARVKLVEDETRALRDLIQARLSEADAKRKQSAESRKQSSDEVKQQSLLRQGYTLLTRLKKEEANWTAARKGRSSGSYSDLQRYRQELETLLHTVESTKMPFDEFKAKFSEISRRASESESIIRSNGEATQTWRERIGGLASKFGSWFSITRVIMAAVRAVRQLITSAKEIDTALTQLKIVTNASNEEMEKFANTAIDLAHNLGKSVAELTKSIETFSRLGYSLTDAAELAKYATIMSNVAGVSTEEATTGITSIIKGYDKDVEDAEHVADILVEVGQKYAVSAAEMMEAYEKSGAALHATNTSLEKSAGLIAAANASVQDASVVGTALKTVSARVRGSKTDLEELGESTDDLAEGFSKYADEIKALTGFDIMIDKTHFKDIYDIFEGISGAWDNLSDTQQARVAEILGGTRQLQVISSILGNWKDAAGAYETAMNSAGASTKANEIYMQSIEARMNQLKATFEALSKTILDSGAMHTAVNSLNWILERVTGLVKITGALPPILATIMGYLSATKNFGRAKMFALKQNMPKAIIVPFGYDRFRYCGCCDTAA